MSHKLGYNLLYFLLRFMVKFGKIPVPLMMRILAINLLASVTCFSQVSPSSPSSPGGTGLRTMLRSGQQLPVAPGWWTLYFTSIPSNRGNSQVAPSASGPNPNSTNATTALSGVTVSSWLQGQSLRGGSRFAINNGYLQGRGPTVNTNLTLVSTLPPINSGSVTNTNTPPTVVQP